MSLYHKHRPSELGEMKGNAEVISAVSGFLEKPDTMPRAYLFHGQTGCGKTTLARIISNKLQITKNDVIEMDSAQFNGIDMVRELRKNAQYKPLESSHRMYILDECHMLSAQAQEGLLKILEDTPKHSIFVLCTTNPEKLKKPLVGRCQQFQMKPLSDRDMKVLLKTITRAEGEKLEPEVLTQIVEDSQGHPRNAIQILEQVLNTEPEKRLEAAKQTAAETSQAIELCRKLISNSNWNQIKVILTGLKGQDAEGIRRVVCGYAQAILLKSDNEKAGLVLEEFIEPFFHTGFPQLTLACYLITKNS